MDQQLNFKRRTRVRDSRRQLAGRLHSTYRPLDQEEKPKRERWTVRNSRLEHGTVMFFES